MTAAIALGVAALLGAATASAGTITGLLSAKGPEAEGAGAGDGAYTSFRYKFAQKVDYDHLENFVIYIDQTVPGAPAPARTGEVTQDNVDFEPHVLPVMVGTKVRWPNKDDIYHNVFSISENAPFDLGLYAKDPKGKEYTFDRPGQVDVFCAIHTKMHCIVLVLPSPYFAKVNANRAYRIENVPAGTYKLTAWHERLPRQSKTLTVPETGEVKVDFVMGPGGLPKS